MASAAEQISSVMTKIRDMNASLQSNDTVQSQVVHIASAVQELLTIANLVQALGEVARTADGKASQVKNEMDVIKQVMSKGDSRARDQKVTESKAASNLKILKSDKGEFKNWNDRLINVFSVIIPHSREFFKELTRQIDISQRPLDEESVSKIMKT